MSRAGWRWRRYRARRRAWGADLAARRWPSTANLAALAVAGRDLRRLEYNPPSDDRSHRVHL